jgi:hypothetical protein
MRRWIAVATVTLVSTVSVDAALAQFPPERATNLKVLPTSISMDSLVNTMAGFTRALGVRCSYCAARHRSQSPARPVTTA